MRHAAGKRRLDSLMALTAEKSAGAMAALVAKTHLVHDCPRLDGGDLTRANERHPHDVDQAGGQPTTWALIDLSAGGVRWCDSRQSFAMGC
ncbi:hypothetical protein Dimus_000716 [Dionaea muscipula]